MRLGEALGAEEARVQELARQTKALSKAVNDWLKAAQTGELNKRERSATTAKELARALVEPLAAAVAAWDFDGRAWLESGAWREELHEVAAAAGLTVLEEDERLISSPVTVRAQPGLNRLVIGARNWPQLHPAKVVAELKKLREANPARHANETLRALQGVWKHLGRPQLLKFREAYDLFCLTPGYKRETPLVLFAQRLRGLHLSGLQTTSDGRRFLFEWPSGDPKTKDIIPFVDEHGETIRYYGIVFE